MTAASTPLWQDEPHAPRPPADAPLRADVCVVGAGIGGLATAWKLLDRGADVVVVEGRTVAAGASGRNGGFFIAGAAPMHHDARERWGRRRAAAIHGATLAAQREMLAVAEGVGARRHFRLTGMLRLAVDAREAADVRAHAAALAADGFDGELIEDLPAPLAGPGRIGLLSPHDGTVQPVRWLRALADALERRGARIFEGTRVTAPPAVAGDRVRVELAGAAAVTCDRAVVAVDGGLAQLVPSAAAVRARRLNMLATEPVAPTLRWPVYARYGYEYVHQTADGRIALGGFSDLDGDTSWTDREDVSEAVQRRLDAYLRDELGVRAGVTHRWAGVVGYASDPLPRCGVVPGTGGRVLALGGYSGTGHVQAWVAAGIVADRAVGRRGAGEGLYAAVDAP